MDRAPHNAVDEGPLPWTESEVLRTIEPRRLSRAAVASIVAHLILLGIFFLMPEIEIREYKPVRVSLNTREPIKLYAPRVNKPQELTQKDPNEGKVLNRLDAFSATKAKPAPRVFQAPPAPRGPAPEDAPLPVASPTPQIDVQIDAPQVAGLTGAPIVPEAPQPPQPRFENISPSTTPADTNPRPMLPKPAAGDVSKSTRPPGGPGGGIISNGDNGSSTSVDGMQLLSDPRNVDFRPYIQAVASKVRQRWFSLAPAIARTNRRPGAVVLVISIDRSGKVPGVVIETASNTPFDQAAVASVRSASPFAPLPTEFNGTLIQLRVALTFNVATAK